MSKASRKRKSPNKTGTPPEAAQPRVELAGIGPRLASVIYDALLIVALNAIVIGLLIGVATPTEAANAHQATVLPEAVRQFVLFPAMVLTTWVFYGYFWRKAGQTLGMQTWRIRVIRPDGSLLDWGDSFGRCAAAIILPAVCGLASRLVYNHPGAFALSLMLGFLGNYVWAVMRGRGLAWHDQLSGTVVIRVPKADSPKRSILGWFSRD
ncbi:MAG TPA: RDD family protein [Fluviicoccus sp.]|nr:RDD family protein [Fluviicoccus sp.]